VGLASAPSGASPVTSPNQPPIYSNWPKNASNWPCFATPSYSCATGGYDPTVNGRGTPGNRAGDWAWREYGPGKASSNSYGYHNCTLYAAWKLEQAGVTDPGNLGDAAQWASKAWAKGILVNQTPTVGSIAQWTSGAGGSGHVAYVESVNSSGSAITISEDNFLSESGYGSLDGGYTAQVHITSNSSVWPANFIHFEGSATGRYAVAFQANTGNLFTWVSTGGGVNTGQGMKGGTSPSITALSNGGYAVAFQANTGNLFTWVSTGGGVNTGQGMMAGTSPSITALSNGSYAIGFEANTANLFTWVSTGGGVNTGQGMMAGTSPGVAR
jgi:surface antigen